MNKYKNLKFIFFVIIIKVVHLWVINSFQKKRFEFYIFKQLYKHFIIL
jgi:hypothetical protein